jgi:fermentation-respiration switch protein FrsA (DUF1100 family)
MEYLIALFVILLLFLAAGYYFYRIAFFPRRRSRETVMQMEIESGKIPSFDDFNTWPHTEISIQSPYGYTLKGYYFPVEGSAKTVVFSHGITITLYGSAKYMPVFRDRGYNILLYDNRSHGESGGSSCSFGYFEKFDLKVVVDWAFEQIGPGGLVGTHGESLGAAITLQHAAIDPRIAFAISDCGFSDLLALFQTRLKEDYHLPPFLILPLSRLFAIIFLGFDCALSSPVRYLSTVKTPILFIHGEKDTYIPTQMVKNLVAAKTNGPQRLYLVPGAGHAYAYSTNPIAYQNQVSAFLDDFLPENTDTLPQVKAV